jgi:hypothetical protein
MPDKNTSAGKSPKQPLGPAPPACPNCGYEEINVPHDFSDDTPITCPRCDYSRPHAQFFGVSGGGG